MVNPDRRSLLETLRDKLLTELSTTAGRDCAPLAKELRAILRELETLASPEEANPLDELASRRKNRQSNAKKRADSA